MLVPDGSVTMRTKLFAIGIVFALVSTAFSVGAFTSTTVERQSNVDVVTDGSGLVGLEDGTSGDLISTNSTGALAIDLTNGSASGANVHARFEFGNPSDPQNQSAFNITNNDGEQRTLTLDYTGITSDDGDNEVDLKFEVYHEGTATPQATLTDESSAKDITLNSGETAHVVMIIDTEDDKGADYSGTLKITA